MKKAFVIWAALIFAVFVGLAQYAAGKGNGSAVVASSYIEGVNPR